MVRLGIEQPFLPALSQSTPTRLMHMAAVYLTQNWKRRPYLQEAASSQQPGAAACCHTCATVQSSRCSFPDNSMPAFRCHLSAFTSTLLFASVGRQSAHQCALTQPVSCSQSDSQEGLLEGRTAPAGGRQHLGGPRPEHGKAHLCHRHLQRSTCPVQLILDPGLERRSILGCTTQNCQSEAPGKPPPSPSRAARQKTGRHRTLLKFSIVSSTA